MADSSLFARPLVAAPRYPKNAPPPSAPADLAHHDALVFSLASTGRHWPFVVDGRAVSVEASGRLEVDNSVFLDFIEQGLADSGYADA